MNRVSVFLFIAALLLLLLTLPFARAQEQLVHRTPTKSISPSLSSSQACTLVSLFFGIPAFTDGNITVKQAAARWRFDLPLFMTLMAQVHDGEIIFDIAQAHHTFWVSDPDVLKPAIKVVEGAELVSIAHARRRAKWNREAVVTWEIRPPRDMLDNFGVSVDVNSAAFACEMTYGQDVPVGFVRLGRRYANSQIFFVRGMLTLGDVVAFLTAASSVSMVGHSLQRSNLFGLFFFCEIGDDYWLDMLMNPLRLEIGAYYGARPRGAVLGNLLFVAGFGVFMQFLAVGVTFYRRRQRFKWPWRRCFDMPPPLVPYKLLPVNRRVVAFLRDAKRFFCPRKSLIVVRWPGIMFIPLSFLATGTIHASTELIRRSLSAGDVVLGLAGFAMTLSGIGWAFSVLREVRKRTVSSVVTVPEKDQKFVTRFDRFCEWIRYNAFRFTTSHVAWFSRKTPQHQTAEQAQVAALLKKSKSSNKKGKRNREINDNGDDDGGGGLDSSWTNQSSVAHNMTLEGDQLSELERYKFFVEEYGSIFDGFHTNIAYYFGLIDMCVAAFVGLMTALKPKIGSVSPVMCATNQLILSLVLSIHMLLMLHFRPWSTVHNRLFSVAFAACTIAMLGVSLWALWKQDQGLQARVDSLDLICNAIALLKLFFDMVSLLLLPSLGGFFGYLFGSASYRMMRQHAWAAEMDRRESEKTAAEEAARLEAEEEEEEEDDEQVEEEPELSQEREAEENDAAAAVPARKPGTKYRVVRKTQIVRQRIVLRKDQMTPEATPDASGEDDEEEVVVDGAASAALRPSAAPVGEADEDEEEEEELEEIVEDDRYVPTPAGAASGPRGLSTLDKFMMI